MPERFQDAIDRAAMQAKAAGTDEYLEVWRASDWQEREGELEAVAEQVASELEREYSEERLAKLVASGGAENPGSEGGSR